MSLFKRFKLWYKKEIIEREFDYNLSLHGYDCDYTVFYPLPNKFDADMFDVATSYVSNGEQKRATLEINMNARNKEIMKIVHDFFIEHNVDSNEIEVGN